MTVSVAMAAYNGIEHIEKQLTSILMQLDETDELVVSDDGSTDGTRQLLDELSRKDERVRVLDGPQSGLMNNFAHAIGACRGDWIFLSDQDDEWDMDKKETVLYAVENTDALLAMHDARVTDSEGRVLQPSFFKTRGTKTGIFKNLWKNSYIGCCMAFSSRLTPYILPFPDGIPMHDQWIGLQAERHGKVVLIDRPLISYRRHGGNVTADSHGTLATMLEQRLCMIRALLSRR